MHVCILSNELPMIIPKIGKARAFMRRWLLAFIAPRPIVGLLYIGRFVLDYWRYQTLNRGAPLRFSDTYPCLTDWTSYTSFDAHYFYQGAWIARHLKRVQPQLHVDIGSSVLTLSTVSAQVDTIFLDYRPIHTNLDGLFSIAGDILRLPFATNSVKSLSCLHVIEHIGLGRYGDPIDPVAYSRAASELVRILDLDGLLYLSTPIGRERIEFNAHRVFAPVRILNLFEMLELVEFSYVDDAGVYHVCADIQEVMPNEYACGFYLFRRARL